MSGIIEVYHAGPYIVEKPDVLCGRPQLDFGQGFYLTDIYEQAINWSVRKSTQVLGVPYVNKYLLHQKSLFEDSNYKILIFKEYDEAWLDFIVGNRAGKQLWKGYDYIEGGVADDRVVDTIDLYVSGVITRDEAIKRLIYLKPNNQICITSQRLIDEYLTYTDSIIVDTI